MRENDLGTNIKSLQIEDLLNRKPIKLDNEEVKKRHFNKTVLVTGGAGSIGSEIVRQVAQFNPSINCGIGSGRNTIIWKLSWK